METMTYFDRIRQAEKEGDINAYQALDLYMKAEMVDFLESIADTLSEISDIMPSNIPPTE